MVRIFIPDNSVTTGAGLAGLTSSSTNLTIAYVRSLDGSSTTYTGANVEAQTTIGTYQAPSSSSKIRFKAVDATSFPGLYELQFHDSSSAFGTGDTSDAIEINIYEASTTALHIGPNMALIPLVPWNYQDGNMGLTGLTGLTAPTAGALPTSGTGSNQISLTSGAVLIQNGLRKNVALAGFQFSLALSSDHFTPATGKTVTATRSIDGGAFGACANSAVELSGGDYKIDLAGSDLNGTTILLEFAASACDTAKYNLVTSP